MTDPQTLPAADAAPNESPAEATPGRRSFLFGSTGKTLLAAGAAAVGYSMLTPSPARAVTPALTFADIPGQGDVKVLNYALSLEALEANLYSQAYGRLTNGGVTGAGRRFAGLGINPAKSDVVYARRFGKIERQHRNFIDGALGDASLLRNAPFDGATFDFGMENLDRRGVLELIYTAEATGVRAYLGAIPFFETKTFLQTAGAIQGTEARHTTTVAILLNRIYNAGIDVAPLANDNNGIDQPLMPNDVLAAVSPFIVL